MFDFFQFLPYLCLYEIRFIYHAILITIFRNCNQYFNRRINCKLLSALEQFSSSDLIFQPEKPETGFSGYFSGKSKYVI